MILSSPPDIEATPITADGSEQTTGTPGEGSAEKSDAEDKEPVYVTPRVLLKKHFDIALSEIRPSSSEEGSLPELRRVSRVGDVRSFLTAVGRTIRRGWEPEGTEKGLWQGLWFWRSIEQERSGQGLWQGRPGRLIMHAYMPECVQLSQPLSRRLQCPPQRVESFFPSLEQSLQSVRCCCRFRQQSCLNRFVQDGLQISRNVEIPGAAPEDRPSTSMSPVPNHARTAAVPWPMTVAPGQELRSH